MTHEALEHLKRRARRRLVGAIVLVLFAIVILWNVLDSDPPARLEARHINVISEISSASQATAIVPPMAPPPIILPSDALPGNLLESTNVSAVAESSAHLPAIMTPEIALAPKPEKPPEAVKAQIKPEKKSQRDPRRILEGLDEGGESDIPLRSQEQAKHYYIQVASYSDAAAAQATVDKLKVAGVRTNTEKIKTDQKTLIRVQVGPYASKASAQAALKKMQLQGMNGILVAR
jgi:DedD protein